MNKKIILDIYEQVRFTNNTFNKPPLSKDDPLYWDKLKSQAKLIKEELDELIEGLENKDFREVRDAVADILVVTLGVAHLSNIDVNSDMQKVTDSNLSKVCPTLEDAKSTQEYYLVKKGVKTEIKPCPTFTGYIIVVPTEQIGSDNKVYPAGKFLKSLSNFKEPNLD